MPLPAPAAMQGGIAGILALLMRDTLRLSQDMARLYDPQPLLGLQRQMLQQWFELATEGLLTLLRLALPAGNALPWAWMTRPEAAR